MSSFFSKTIDQVTLPSSLVDEQRVGHHLEIARKGFSHGDHEGRGSLQPNNPNDCMNARILPLSLCLPACWTLGAQTPSHSPSPTLSVGRISGANVGTQTTLVRPDSYLVTQSLASTSVLLTKSSLHV